VTPLQRRFQKRLRQLRGNKVNQWQAAALCGVSENYYQRLEGGHDPNPTLKVLEQIAKGFNVQVHELLAPEGTSDSSKQSGT
jgi:transcriptional regulator with XRE-family HTH domain